MDFLTNLKQRISDAFLGLSINARDLVQNEGPPVLYALAVVAALTEVVGSSSYAAFNSLMALLGGIGSDLLANKLEKAVDQDQVQALVGNLLDRLKGLDELSAARVVQTELQNSPNLRVITDDLLQKTDALALAQRAFNETHASADERQWFASTLQQAVQQAGSQLKIVTQVKARGGSAAAKGKKAKAQSHKVLAKGKGAKQSTGAPIFRVAKSM